MRSKLLDSSTEISGFYDVLEESGGCQVVPTVAAHGGVRRPGRPRDLRRAARRPARAAQAARPDAVLLALHGAMCTEEADDGDGLLLADVRSVVGAECPIFVTHDLHANLTRHRAALCDAVVGYRTAPHVDHRSTGARAARLLLRTLSTGVRPRNCMAKIPLMAPSVRMNTSLHPLRTIVRRAQALESNPATPSISAFWMQPWLDVEDAGAAVNVVCFGDPREAEPILQELAAAVWDTRHDLDLDLPSPSAAVREALVEPARPCVLADTGDAPPGGAPGDSNVLLDALLEAGCAEPAFLTLFDPDAARAMHAAGRGARIRVRLGGAVDRRSFTPREYEGVVETLSDGRFVYSGPIARGQEARIGRAGVLGIGAVKVLVHELPAFSHDPAIFRSVGLEIEQAKIVVVKSPTQFRATYEPIAGKIYEVGTPGICSVDLRSLPFTRIPRPMYPFDPEAEVDAFFRTTVLGMP